MRMGLKLLHALTSWKKALIVKKTPTSQKTFHGGRTLSGDEDLSWWKDSEWR